jgi:hypothetical protein
MTARAVTAIVPFETADESIMEERTMEPILIQVDDPDAQEDILVHAWRTEQLWRLGLTRALAETFADLVDWHSLADLIERGCSPELALDIVR